MKRMSDTFPNPPLDALTCDFLAWLASGPRTHADVMDAWRSSCPRLTVWEDALIAGLVHVDGSTSPARVTITARGEAMLESFTSG